MQNMQENKKKSSEVTMPRKPDRWERVVKKYGERGMPDYDNHVLADHEAISLLRKEHAWITRMVKDRKATTNTYATKTGWWDGYDAACKDILNQLAQRRK